jgi:hypothetical protein
MKNLIFATSALCALIPVANAVTIDAVGNSSGYAVTGDEALSFYTTSVSKTFDVNGDNQYGTDGYLVFGGANGKVNSADYGIDTNRYSELLPSFVTSFTVDTDVTLVRNNDSQVVFDDPDADVIGTDFSYGGYLMNNSHETTTDILMMSFSVETTESVTFRLGILAGNTNQDQYQASAFTLSYFDGTDTISTNIADLDSLTDSMGMVFFDVTLDAGASGTFSILADESSSNPILNGITFDVVPEPSSYALLAGCLALTSVMLRRRRA